MKAEFKQWAIMYFLAPFSWSKWIDIDTFSFGMSAYLLQAKVNKSTNAKKFRVTKTKNNFGVADIGNLKLEKLTEAKLTQVSL